MYSQDTNEVAKLANAMTKQIGGSYESNFKLIEQGFKKGADLNGNFVSSLQSNITVLKDMGMSGEQAIALMAKGDKRSDAHTKSKNSKKKEDFSVNEYLSPEGKAIGYNEETTDGNDKKSKTSKNSRWTSCRLSSGGIKNITMTR